LEQHLLEDISWELFCTHRSLNDRHGRECLLSLGSSFFACPTKFPLLISFLRVFRPCAKLHTVRGLSATVELDRLGAFRRMAALAAPAISVFFDPDTPADAGRTGTVMREPGVTIALGRLMSMPGISISVCA
jgi:hypothetical protein